MKKILFVITKSNWGGAQRYVHDIATNLPKQEWRVAIALGGTGRPKAPAGRLEEELRRKDVRTLFIPSFMRDISVLAEWRVLRELWKLFKQENPDVVHLNSSKAGGLGALAGRLAGVPHIVFTLHGSPWLEDRNALSRLAIFLSSWITFLLSHTVITISADAYNRARSLPFCRRRVVLIHNGLAPLEFVSAQEARRALMPEGMHGTLIGTIGELTWNKGHHTLLRAAGILKRRGKDVTLCIIGEGEERAFLKTVADEEDIAERVHFAGFVPEAYRYLKAFDIFALASLKEGLPYVLIEAGQAGLPVVATSTGGVPDIIAAGVSGLLAKPKDADELADRLEELLGNAALSGKLRQALHEAVSKEFSLEQMLARTIEAYAR